MDIFKKPAVMLIVVAAIIIAVLWSYFAKVSQEKEEQKQAEQAQEEAQSAIVNLTTIAASEFDEVVKTQYAQAKSKAEEVNQDYKLSGIQVILSSLELNSGDTRYIFSSQNDTLNNWTITFSNSSGNFIRAAIPKNDFLGDLAGMDTSQWKFNYVTAIQIAENNGGKEWRQSNGLSSAEIFLRQEPISNILLWTVKYNSGTESFSINIEASSGKTVE